MKNHNTQTTQLIISFQALDKIGIIQQLSNSIKRHQANWLESQISELGGVFSGLIAVNSNHAQSQALIDDLLQLDAIDVAVYKDNIPLHQGSKHYCLELLGPDRAGIIYDISQTLSAHGLNINQMKSSISSAPMSGEPLFAANISCSTNLNDLDTLANELDMIAEELTLDISFNEVDR